MNRTVARIVELLFEDVAESEEVLALKEEVMDNSQERYEDMVRQGLSEDDAIAAVIRSLEGMETLLADYPKKEKTNPFEKEPGGERTGTAVKIDADRLRNLSIVLVDADVKVSEGDGFTYEAHGEGLTLRQEGDTLIIRQENETVRKAQTGGFAAAKSGKMTFSILLDGIGRLLNVGSGMDAELTVTLPRGRVRSAEIRTVSGNVEWEGGVEKLSVVTTNGDVDIRGEGSGIGELDAVSTSGDVDLRGRISAAKIKTMSGDMDMDVNGAKLQANSTSGDIDAVCRGVREVKLTTISGDLDLRAEDTDALQANMKSTSGDLDLTLPGAAADVNLTTRTVSGDVDISGLSISETSKHRAVMETVSGDITVERG